MMPAVDPIVLRGPLRQSTSYGRQAFVCSQAQHGTDLLHHVPAIMRDAQFERSQHDACFHPYRSEAVRFEKSFP